MAFTCSRKDGSSHGTEYSTLRVITCASVRAPGEYDVRDLRVWIEGRRSPALRLEPLVSLGGGDSRRRGCRSKRSSNVTQKHFRNISCRKYTRVELGTRVTHCRV